MEVAMPTLVQVLAYLKSLFSGLVDPTSILIQLLVLGAGCSTAGAYLLLGLPWALIVGGGIAFILAAILARGMTRG